MLSLEKFKESLGDLKDKLSEEDILALREHQDRMSEVFFAMWLQTLKENKKEEILV